MSVWVRIDELPVEYYDKEAQFEIGKIIVKSIQVDYVMDKLTRARYARVCVDVDLTKPLVTRVWVGGQWRVIFYENISILCFNCGKIGHVKQACTAKGDNPNDKDGKSGEGDGDTGPGDNQLLLDQTHINMSQNNQNTYDNLHNGERDVGYGPWTTIQNKKNNKPKRGNHREGNSKISEYMREVRLG